MKKRYKNIAVRYRRTNENILVSMSDIERILSEEMSERDFIALDDAIALIESSKYKKKTSLIKWLYCEVAGDPQRAFKDQNKKSQMIRDKLEAIAVQIDYLHSIGREYEGEIAEFPVPLDEDLISWGTVKERVYYTVIDGKKYNILDYYERTRG